MKRVFLAMTAGFIGLFVAASECQAQSDSSQHQLGVGVHYWTSLKDIDIDEIDEDGFSYSAIYQYHYGLIGVEAALGWFKKGFAGSTKAVYQPQISLILGKAVYAAAGVGGYYSDGEWGDDPFYALRAGLDIPLLPFLHLDINVNYRFEDLRDFRDDSKKIDTDTVTLGAAVRMVF